LNNWSSLWTFIVFAYAACGLNIKLPMEKIEDIDAGDVYNELAVVEYAEDIYKFYKEAEANHLCRRHLQVLQGS